MCRGEVVTKAYDASGYGNYIIMKDSQTNMGFLYAHLDQPSLKNVGDSVQIGELVGYEGTTGSSTGIHLHLEMQDLTNHTWIYQGAKEIYTNPAEFMGIPNVEGISVYYDGIPKPVIIKTRNKFKWVLYANKLRKKSNKFLKIRI